METTEPSFSCTRFGQAQTLSIAISRRGMAGAGVCAIVERGSSAVMRRAGRSFMLGVVELRSVIDVMNYGNVGSASPDRRRAAKGGTPILSGFAAPYLSWNHSAAHVLPRPPRSFAHR